MKKITFCILSLSFALVNLNAQTNKEINFLDLANANLKETFKKNQRVRVKVTNINRFLYKITTEKSENDFHMTIPPILSGIKLPSFLNIKSPAASEGAPAPKDSKADGSSTADELKADIEENIQQLIKIQRFLDDAVSLHNSIVALSKICGSTYANIESDVMKDLKEFTKGDSATIDKQSDIIKNEIKYKLTVMLDIDGKLKEQFENWRKVELKEVRQGAKEYKDAKTILDKELKDLKARLVKATKAQKITLTAAVKAKEDEISRRETGHNDKTEDRVQEGKDLTTDFELAKSLIESIKKFREDGREYIIIDAIKKVNESNYSYYTEETEMKKDEVKLVISAVADGQLTCNRPNEQKFTVKLRTEGGAKLDFSTGVFFNGGSKTFLGQGYFYEPVDSAHSKISPKDGGKRMTLSVGALMHIYRRSPADVKFGGVIGASISTDLDVLNFHAGGSLILGDEERFCLSSGISLREVNVLDYRYKAGPSYEKTLLPEVVPVTKKFPVAGFFFALTYNFTRFNK